MSENKAIYKIDRWNITESAFPTEDNYRNETTFALSNGYIGTRGTFEEGYSFSVEEGLEGNYINGFYESEDIRYGEWNFGFPTQSQSLLNLPNLKVIKLQLEEEEFDLREGKTENYQRILHMKEGIVTRDLCWESPGGKKIKLHTERLVSFTHKNIVAMRYEITPLNFTGSIRLCTELQAEVSNQTRKTNPLVDYGPFGRHLMPDTMDMDEKRLYYQGTTLNSKLTMACQSLNEVHGKIGETKVLREGHKSSITYRIEGKQDELIALDKYIAYSSQLDMPSEELRGFLDQELQQASVIGYPGLKEEQAEYMDAFWKQADVVIEGDDSLQQGIRFNLFHMMQAVGRDGRTGTGAKGLSGEGYEGHYFWDTEMYVLPVLAYTDPKLARSILDYRYGTLEEARKRARVLGHEKGALYPWRTINGQEASTYFPLGTAQYHINADIAYAFKLYVTVSGEYGYLEEKAAEVLVETARVWADVGCFAESKGNRYCICAVTGPDEYNAIVDNNFYTNLMARENIKDAIWALDTIKEWNRCAYEELIQRLQIEEEEVQYWKRIVEHMYFPFDEARQIYPMDDGFMQRKPWDDSKIPPEKRHLLYENYHPLFIFRQRMSKQADAILGMLLHSDLFTREELIRNYDFYQEVTLHHSSLSTCIFGILASRIGYGEEAYRYFAQSARMDLDDHHNNFYAGIHIANMAGSWQAIVFGFGGVREQKGILECSPITPPAWIGYEFNLQYQGSLLNIKSNRTETVFTLKNSVGITFMAYEKKCTLQNKGDSRCISINHIEENIHEKI